MPGGLTDRTEAINARMLEDNMRDSEGETISEEHLTLLALDECLKRNLFPDDEETRRVFRIGFQMGFRQDGFHHP